MNKPELLAPANNLDILKIACLYGADAVYCGTPNFAMRSRVGFTFETLKEGIAYAHSIDKKVYVTLNAALHPLEVEKMKKHALAIAKLKPDALIVSDLGMVKFLLKKINVPIHLSTQANTTNQLSAKFWQDQGVERVVLARELSLKEIKKINKSVNIQLEAFVHGAMCMAYSGRCQISNYLTGRNPNKGECVQACRFKYKMYALEEEQRKGEFFPLYEDESGTYILNSKDLCMVDNIDKLVEAGISSFKIEGRLKSEYYVACVVRAYRQAIDLYFANPSEYSSKRKEFLGELKKTANRGLTTGFFFKKPTTNTNNYKSSKAKSSWGYIGRVLDYDKTSKALKFECKNLLNIGAELEIITPNKTYLHKLELMVKDNIPVETAHADNIIEIEFDTEVPKDSLIRVKL
jgi:putative protease